MDSIGAYRFFLEKGKNTISFESVQAKLGISEIALVPAKEIVSYAEYFDTLTKEGAQIIDANEVDGGDDSGRGYYLEIIFITLTE